MIIDKNDWIFELQGQPKDQEQVVMEPGLWLDICTTGTKFLLKFLAKNNKSSCDDSGECCSTAIMQS